MDAKTTPRAVDRLEVLILVDNVTDQLSTNPEFVRSELQHLVRGGLTEWGGEAICCAHFGLSLLITAHAGDESRTLLFDGGPEGYAIERNGGRLQVDFGAVEAVVLSHGHWDHAGGLLAALQRIRAANGGQSVPCHLHADMFRQRGLTLPDGKVLPFKPIPQPDELEQHGAEVHLSAEEQTLLDGCFYLSGEIPRVTAYEKGLPPHVRRAGGNGDWEPDPLIMDERFLAVHVQDKGLIVFTACSHAGVVNVLTEARRRFPEVNLYAVMGGLHLSGPAPEQVIPETVRDLAALQPGWIIPCHCTGWRAVTALVNAFGEERVAPGAVGKHFTF